MHCQPIIATGKELAAKVEKGTAQFDSPRETEQPVGGASVPLRCGDSGSRRLRTLTIPRSTHQKRSHTSAEQSDQARAPRQARERGSGSKGRSLMFPSSQMMLSPSTARRVVPKSVTHRPDARSAVTANLSTSATGTIRRGAIIK